MNQSNNVNEEREIDLLELLRLLWNNKKRVIKWGFIAGCIGIVVAFSIPKSYTSKAIMVPELESKSGNSSLGSLASLAGINLDGSSNGITEQFYPQIIKSTPFVFEFANMEVDVDEKQFSLLQYFNDEYKKPWWVHLFSAPLKGVGLIIEAIKGKEEGDDSTINIKALTKKQLDYKAKFGELVTLTVDPKTMEIVLSVETQSPEISLMLADSILVSLQQYMTLYKTSKVRAELESNKNMMSEAQANYYRADSIYASAVDRNRNTISSVAMVALERLENEKKLTYQIYSQIAAQVEYNKTQLNEETPILTIIEPATLEIEASAPKKPLIVLGFAFLGGFIICCIITMKFIYSNDKDDK